MENFFQCLHSLAQFLDCAGASSSFFICSASTVFTRHVPKLIQIADPFLVLPFELDFIWGQQLAKGVKANLLAIFSAKCVDELTQVQIVYRRTRAVEFAGGGIFLSYVIHASNSC